MNKIKSIQHVLFVIMKITATQLLLMTILTTLVSAEVLKGQGVLDKRISLDADRLEVKTLLNEIESKAEVAFTYSPKLIKHLPKVTLSVKEAKLSEVLNQIFSPSIEFYLVNEEIVLKATKEEVTGTKIILLNQITGKITDENGDGLPGVNVVVKGSTNGTVSDAFGNYTLEVPGPESVLVFSSVGYATEEAVVGTQSVVNVSLTVDIKTLSEIVVVGYGSQEKGVVTGAVSSVNMDNVRGLPLTNAGQALQGRIAGVQVVQTGGGAPGGAMQVNIRGVGTINGETPLYVIDGIPVQGGRESDKSYSFLNSLNPNDIESIDVLKDASSAAIYGSRASGGVVLITTKRGKEGPVRVNFDAYYGVQNNTKTYDVLDADGYKRYLKELHSQPDGSIPGAFAGDAVPRNTNTDWQKELFKANAPIQNYNLGISGGKENALFSMGLEYFNQDGTIINTAFERYNIRLNSDFKIGKKIKIGETVLLSKTIRNQGNDGGGRRLQEHAIKQSPFVNVYDDTFLGGFGWPDVNEGQDARNPIADQNLVDNYENRYRFWGSLYGQYEIVKGLTYKLQLGMDFSYQDNYTANPEYQQVRRLTQFSSLNKSRSQQISPLIEQFLTYNKKFGRSNLTVMAGFSAQSFTYSSIGASGTKLPVNVYNLSAATDQITISDSFNESALRSLFGRATYSFNDKYLLTANIRRDESSKLFRGNNPTGIFPSVSAGWRVSEESFMSGVDWISNLKVRAGYGEVGNQSSLGNYPVDVNLRTDFFYVLGGQAVQGISQNNLSNPDITWETSKQVDVGIDAEFLNNKIELTLDYYQRTTEDLIWPQQVAPSVGLAAADVNAGEIRNRGIEVAMTYRKREGDFQFDISGNFTTIDNKVISLVNDDLIIKTGSPTDDLTNASWTQVGSSIGSFYGYVNDGIFRNWDEVYDWAFINQAVTGAKDPNGIPIQDPTKRDATTAVTKTAPGDVKWVDVNGDGIVDAKDQVELGNPIPKVIYGLTANARYKGFDFQIFFQGSQGNDIFNAATRWLSDNRQNFNVGAVANNSTAYRDQYTASEPRLVRADPNKNILRNSDRYISDGSYMRIKNLTFGYNLPSATLNRIKASKLRVYASVQNLATFTKYDGLEPEVGSFSSGTGLDAGIDRLLYPQPRTFIFGVQVGF